VNRGARLSTAAISVVFGFLLTASGFGNYTTIHHALLLRSWYLYAVFGSALAVAAAGLTVLRQSGTTVFGGPLRLPPRPGAAPLRRRHLRRRFGLTGTCPGVLSSDVPPAGRVALSR
jgi:hypothetical protein